MPSTRSGRSPKGTPRRQRHSSPIKEAEEESSPEPLATQLAAVEETAVGSGEDSNNNDSDDTIDDNAMTQEDLQAPPAAATGRDSGGEETETEINDRDDDDGGDDYKPPATVRKTPPRSKISKQQASASRKALSPRRSTPRRPRQSSNPGTSVGSPQQQPRTATPRRRRDDEEKDPEALLPAVIRPANRMLFDLLDYELEVILTERTNRTEHYDVFVTLYDEFYQHDDLHFGRIYVRSLLASLLVEGVSDLPHSLNAWKAVQWQDMAADVETAYHAHRRRDALVRVVTGTETANAAVVESRTEGNSKGGRTQLQWVRELLELHRILAPIRQTLVQSMENGETGPPQLRAEEMQAVFDDAMASDEESLAHLCIPTLFLVADGEDEAADTPKRQPVLHNLEDIKAKLKRKPFKLEWFQKKFERLVIDWNKTLFGTSGHDVTLHRLDYHKVSVKPEKPHRQKNRLSNQTAPCRRIARLQADRHILETAHGDDPLEESRVVAAHAVGAEPPKRRETRQIAQKTASALYRPKRSAHALQFNSDNDDATDADEGRAENTPKRSRSSTGTPGDAPRVQLSNVPDSEEFQATVERAKAVATESNKYEGPAPDSGLFDAMGNVTRRQRWTDEETNALLCGLEEFGEGKWVKIRNRYCDVLKNRTTVQIKDRFRTLKKRGEVPNQYL